MFLCIFLHVCFLARVSLSLTITLFGQRVSYQHAPCSNVERELTIKVMLQLEFSTSPGGGWVVGGVTFTKLELISTQL